MLDVDISRRMANDECMKFLKGSTAPGRSPVALFRTSLAMSLGQVASAELFTVDRRTSHNDSDKPRATPCKSGDAMGFLVGLRLCEPCAIEPHQAHVTELTTSKNSFKPSGTSRHDPEALCGKQMDSAALPTIAEEQPQQMDLEVAAAAAVDVFWPLESKPARLQ